MLAKVPIIQCSALPIQARLDRLAPSLAYKCIVSLFYREMSGYLFYICTAIKKKAIQQLTLCKERVGLALVCSLQRNSASLQLLPYIIMTK